MAAGVFIVGRKAWTMFGWTPGLRHLLTGRVLPCGCLTGTYDTVRGERIEIMDNPNAACREQHHQLHVVLSRTAAGRRGARHRHEQLTSTIPEAGRKVPLPRTCLVYWMTH
jgi:hypothetical protein